MRSSELELSDGSWGSPVLELLVSSKRQTCSSSRPGIIMKSQKWQRNKAFISSWYFTPVLAGSNRRTMTARVSHWSLSNGFTVVDIGMLLPASSSLISHSIRSDKSIDGPEDLAFGPGVALFFCLPVPDGPAWKTSWDDGSSTLITFRAPCWKTFWGEDNALRSTNFWVNILWPWRTSFPFFWLGGLEKLEKRIECDISVIQYYTNKQKRDMYQYPMGQILALVHEILS